MNVQRFSSARRFLDVAGAFLASAEIENNLILGIARAFGGRADDAGAALPLFAAVVDGRDVLMCAFQTIPGRLGITQAREPAAIAALVGELQTSGPDVASVFGPEPTVASFADCFADTAGRRFERRNRQRLHQLHRVTPLGQRVAGHLRLAGHDEEDLIRDWLTHFFLDVGEPGSSVAAVAAQRMREGRMYVWTDATGRVVSMAAAVQVAPRGVRIAFVYTPPPDRRHGYASACVETLSQTLLDAGNEYCCLFTDLANPTSNAMYRRLGYQPVLDAATYRFLR